MSSNTVCKTVHQYNKEPIPPADMQKLLEIAEDYSKVKNYVYERYGGIGSLSKIYPGYTVQNEMTESGLRARIGLPSVYFYLAIFDALGDIRAQWTRVKTKVSKLLSRNGNLTAEEKHYLRFVLKTNNAFAAALNGEEIELPKELQAKHDELEKCVDADRLLRYLCRQVRKCLVKPHTDKAEGFSIAERAYRYGDHGIYIATKEKRKRIFVLLTDGNEYRSQLYIRLYPEERRIEIKAAVHVAVRSHAEYTNRIGLAAGMFTMLTTSDGHTYGEEFGRYQSEYAEWIRGQTGSYNRNRADNPGRKKYGAKKRRFEERLHSYINHELNRLLENERPQTVYIVKPPGPGAGGVNRKINHAVGLWQRGYVRRRLTQKCREQSVELVEVPGKDISNECSNCGMTGKRREGTFVCEACGYESEEKTNTARNVLRRGTEGKAVH